MSLLSFLSVFVITFLASYLFGNPAVVFHSNHTCIVFRLLHNVEFLICNALCPVSCDNSVCLMGQMISMKAIGSQGEATLLNFAFIFHSFLSVRLRREETHIAVVTLLYCRP